MNDMAASMGDTCPAPGSCLIAGSEGFESVSSVLKLPTFLLFGPGELLTVCL